MSALRLRRRAREKTSRTMCTSRHPANTEQVPLRRSPTSTKLGPCPFHDPNLWSAGARALLLERFVWRADAQINQYDNKGQQAPENPERLLSRGHCDLGHTKDGGIITKGLLLRGLIRDSTEFGTLGCPISPLAPVNAPNRSPAPSYIPYASL
jgi:hypothetical protein